MTCQSASGSRRGARTSFSCLANRTPGRRPAIAPVSGPARLLFATPAPVTAGSFYFFPEDRRSRSEASEERFVGVPVIAFSDCVTSGFPAHIGTESLHAAFLSRIHRLVILSKVRVLLRVEGVPNSASEVKIRFFCAL